MKRILLFAVLIQFVTPVFAEKGKDVGFSYFAVGVENITYEEKASIASVKTKATISNPVLITGGLFNINDQWDFSLRAESSLFPGDSKESWSVKEGQTLGALIPSDNPIQTNQFTMTTSSTRVMSHYKLTPQVRFMAGGEYALVTFKRFQFATDYPATVTLTPGVVEESVGVFDLSLGLAYESNPSVNSDMRYHLSLTVDKPLYKKLINSNAPDVIFNSTEGIGFNGMAGITFQMTKNLHLGTVVAYDYREFEKEVKINPATGLSIEIPENLTLHTKFSLIAVYNF